MAARYQVVVRYSHRKWGPRRWTTDVDATSVRAAISHGLGRFFDQADPSDRRGARAAVKIEALRLAGKEVAT